MATLTAQVRTDAGVNITIAMSASVTSVTLVRYDPSGFSSYIRAGNTVPLTGGQAIVYDFEAPLDVDVYYVATQATPTGTETATSNTVRILSNGWSWLKDPGIPTRNLRIPIVTSIAELTRPARSGVFDIINRSSPVVVSSMRRGAAGELVMHTTTDTERSGVLTLVSRGTVLLLQSPAAYGWGTQYISAGDVAESRVGLAADQWRKWTLPFVIVDRPPGLATMPFGYTWQQNKTDNATWQTLRDRRTRWSDVLLGNLVPAS